MHQPPKSTSVLILALVRLVLVAPWVFGTAASAAAQPGVVRLLDTLQGAPPGVTPRLEKTPGGAVRFVAAPRGGYFAAASTGDAEGRARAFLGAHRSAFGVASDRLRFATRSVRPVAERTAVRLDQLYDGVPVFGAQALVQVGSEGVEAAVLDLLRKTSPLDGEASPTIPELAADAASEIALREVASDEPNVALALRAAPRLVVFAPEVLDLEGPPRLSWQVEVGSPSGFPAERLLVDARDGSVLLRHSLAHRALDRQVFDAQHSSTVPANPARSEGDPATGDNEVDDAYDYAEDTYLFYLAEHGRDSLDDAGHPLVSVVRYCPKGNCAVDDAFWDGSRAFYSEGFVADDVVGHELTHGLTQLTSELIYLNQSGAINESLSDIWGELIDLTNAAGNDSAFARWLIAEDSTIGFLRDMADPPTKGDPDSTCHPSYFEGVGDNGGVHVNSGILNKLAYLLVDRATRLRSQRVAALCPAGAGDVLGLAGSQATDQSSISRPGIWTK